MAALDPPPARDQNFFGTPWQKWFSLIPKFTAETAITATNVSGGTASVTSLTNTGTTTLATSLTGALRVDSGVVSVGMVRTADVTPVLVGSGQLTSASHSFGVVPSIVILEYLCLTAEQGYVAGEVVQVNSWWNGVTIYPIALWKTASAVGFQPAAGYLVVVIHKTTGGHFTPTAANWAHRFVIMK